MKKVAILLILISILMSSYIIYNDFIKKDTSINTTLKKLGYTSNDIEKLHVLSKDSIKLIADNPYNPMIIEIVVNASFKEEKLSEYLKYHDNENIKTVIALVNNEINVPYSNTINDIVNDKYYLEKNLVRYINYMEKSDDGSEIVKCVNTNVDHKFYTDDKEADLSKGTLILVNKFYKLSKDFVPENIVQADQYCYMGLTKVAKDEFTKMANDALQNGLHIRNTSSYRDYELQEWLYNNYSKNETQEQVDTHSARPGYSEHQTGLAIDLVTDKVGIYGFANTEEFIWLQKNAHKYGFILRYPKDKEYLTGYQYEPWHYRYVGNEVATYIYENNITFDEYYAYFLE